MVKGDVQAANKRPTPKGLADHLGAGHAAFRAKKWDEADRHFAKALTLESHHAEAAHMRGLSAYQRGAFEQAAELISDALETESTDSNYHYNLAMTFQQMERTDAAIEHLRRAIICRPDHSKAYNNLGNISRDTNPKAAAETSRRALALRPDYAMAHNNLGSACRELKSLDQAEQSFKRCIVLEPQFALAYSNSCAVALDDNVPAIATVAARRALILDSSLKTALNMYGWALRRSDREEESLAVLKAAASLSPGDAETIANLATTHEILGVAGARQALYRRAVLCDPTYPEAHRNLGIILLTAGQWQEGWAEYDWRLKTAAFKNNIKQPLWAGEELGDKRLMLHAEQGFGDTLQFCRYVAMAAQRAKVTLVAPKPLKRLLSGLKGVDVFCVEGDKPPAFESHCPLLTLPRIFATVEETVPPAPYLEISEADQRHWSDRLNLDGKELTVGLVWAGSRTHLGDSRRSVPVETYLPLMDIPKVRWVSLQVGYRSQDYARLGEGRVTDLSGQLTDFADTAAVMANLDLLISVDTSAVHLAGATGRPAWVMLSTCPDWRWQEEREDTPWYPSLRLFRQKESGNWAEVVDRIKVALSAMAEGHQGPAGKQSLPRAAKAITTKSDRWSDSVAKAMKDLRAKQLEEAGRELRQVLVDRPDHPGALHVRGLLAHERKHATEAFAWIGRALRIKPDFPDALYNFGVVLDSVRRHEESIEIYRRALIANPQSQRAYCNLSNARRVIGELDDAIRQGKRAMALQPDYAKAGRNLAMAQLLSGKWEDGWPSYEARWRSGDMKNRPESFKQPQWAGEPLDGKTLFIYAEQGLGDTLQFYPYALLAAKRGPVVIEVQPELRQLFEGLPGVDRVIAHGDPVPDFAYHCPLLSLPKVFRTTPETIRPRRHSLGPDPRLVEEWRKRLRAGAEGVRVGLAWAGNPSHLNDHNRSIGIETLAPLFGMPGVRWLSLQVGPRTADLAAPEQNYPVEDLSKSLTDFSQTAAALRHLDLVITVDTSVCHLAGDLGLPTWLLLPAVPDWRWLQGRTDTPWYPTVRLFRQTARGDWGGVVKNVKTALTDLLKEKAGS